MTRSEISVEVRFVKGINIKTSNHHTKRVQMTKLCSRRVNRSFQMSDLQSSYTIIFDLIADTSECSTPQKELKKSKNTETDLRKLFFSDRKLLESYAKILLNERNFKYYGTVLIDYYESRGRINDLFEQLAMMDLATLKSYKLPFRGVTPFSRVYEVYVSQQNNKMALSMEQQVMSGIASVVSNDTETNDQEVEIVRQELLKSLIVHMDKFSSRIRDIITVLYQIVRQYSNRYYAHSSLVTLMFLRYLFQPFKQHPKVFNILQRIVNNYENDKDLQAVIIDMLNVPLMDTIHELDMSVQERSLKEITSILKNELHRISSVYEGDTAELFSVVKGNVKKAVEQYSVNDSTKEMYIWFIQKEELLREENSRLLYDIEKMKRGNDRLLELIEKMSKL